MGWYRMCVTLGETLVLYWMGKMGAARSMLVGHVRQSVM